MVFPGLLFFFLHFFRVHKRESVDKPDDNGNDQDKQVGAISDYLVEHRSVVIEFKCKGSALFDPNKPLNFLRWPAPPCFA